VPSPAGGCRRWSAPPAVGRGCFLLGALLAIVGRRSPEPAWVKPLLGVGVLGGYTTYSTFAVEVVRQVDAGSVLLATGYVLVSVVGGVSAVAAGAVTGRLAR
jgi:CrcB protein